MTATIIVTSSIDCAVCHRGFHMSSEWVKCWMVIHVGHVQPIATMWSSCLSITQLRSLVCKVRQRFLRGCAFEAYAADLEGEQLLVRKWVVVPLLLFIISNLKSYVRLLDSFVSRLSSISLVFLFVAFLCYLIVLLLTHGLVGLRRQ